MTLDKYFELLDEYGLKVFLLPSDEQLQKINEESFKINLERIKRIFNGNTGRGCF